MLGYASPEELMAVVTDIGSRLYVEPSHRTELIRLMDASGRVLRFETKFYQKDHSTLWVSISARVVFNARGDTDYYEGSIEDISERKRMEGTKDEF